MLWLWLSFHMWVWGILLMMVLDDHVGKQCDKPRAVRLLVAAAWPLVVPVAALYGVHDALTSAIRGRP